MIDTPKVLTVAELERMAAEAEAAATHCKKTGAAPSQFIDWPGTLAMICRQALAQAAQIEALIGLPADAVNELLERWDQTALDIQRGIVARFANLCRSRAAEVERLQAYKDWTHAYLDAVGVPHHPPGPHGAEGCRIGDRMDWLMTRLNTVRAALEGLLDGLDANGDPERCGLSQQQWDRRIKSAREVIP